MFLLTWGFCFLDIINYLGPWTSYEKWVKAYECKTVKSWFPYKWFDTPEKLDFPWLPKYEKWYSKLEGGYVLTRDEWEGCQRLFKEKGMRTFSDWLHYYNNLDVAPGLQALEKMRNFYTEKGIDILKDAVSIPGVSLHYLLRGAVERDAELYSPGKEAYEMLKEAVVGSPSLVFTRHHEVDVTEIRSHRISELRLCKNILGYDVNTLYLSTMLREMPCGKERVVHYSGTFQAEVAPVLTHRLKEGNWFGFAEVDIKIPERLRPKFEEMSFLLQQKGACRSCAETYGRLLNSSRQKARRRKKTCGGAVCRRVVGVRPSALVREPRGGSHKGLQNNRLPTGQDLFLVRGAGDGGTPDRRRG